jgi:histidinol-phosphate aminotransferase
MNQINTNKDLFNSWLNETKAYQAGKTFEELAKEFGFKQSEILRLAGNESTIGTSPIAIKAAQDASVNSNFYAEPKSESLLIALEENFSKDIDMSGLKFVCGNGMDSVIEHCLALFTKSGDSIVNIAPTFIYYEFAAQRQGLEIIQVKREEATGSEFVKKFIFEIDDVINAIKDNTKIIFLCTPNNPDGSVVDLEQIKKLAKVCLDRGVVLFVDHAYIEFTDRKKLDAREIIKDFPNMIIGYTFSKAYAMAGFRVGYALMHQEMQDKFLTLLTPFLIAKPSIAAAQAALNDKEHLSKILSNNSSQKLWLELELQALKCEVFQGEANFLLFKHENESLFNELLKKGIIIREMKSINAFRVTVGTPEENKRLIKSLKEILS